MQCAFRSKNSKVDAYTIVDIPASTWVIFPSEKFKWDKVGEVINNVISFFSCRRAGCRLTDGLMVRSIVSPSFTSPHEPCGFAGTLIIGFEHIKYTLPKTTSVRCKKLSQTHPPTTFRANTCRRRIGWQQILTRHGSTGGHKLTQHKIALSVCLIIK